MKTIKEHNDERRRLYADKYKTGVECPNCKAELQKVEPKMILCSAPPQIRVKCLNCGLVETIIA